MSLNYDVQMTNLPMPVDLSQFIAELEDMYENTENPFKRRLIRSQIEHNQDLEKNQNMMQRQRYVIFAESIKEDTPSGRHDVFLELKERREEVISSLTEMDLTAEPVTDLDIVRYLHTLFDFSGARTRPIESLDVPQIIEGGSKAHA
ncbi:hypothetical protein [Priestia megaterium]|uniref:hypothetical protein n=1 Tax=Priestia megaterium TaxID=1404 RepID=UPI000BFC7B31|nr:hypothetical protein [Priestia megaterium]PGQ88350.1 hypothetical protein COA18_05315 [Priestia megaterium]